jgi:hypothetical protein
VNSFRSHEAAVAKNSFSERLITFYQDQFVSQADMVFRVSYALSLSIDKAHEIVNKTYADVVESIEGTMDSGEGDYKTMLLKHAWKNFQAVGAGGKSSNGESAITKALSAIDQDARGALTMVDLAGLSCTDAASTLGVDEKALREQLAKARKTLMMSTLDY